MQITSMIFFLNCGLSSNLKVHSKQKIYLDLQILYPKSYLGSVAWKYFFGKQPNYIFQMVKFENIYF